jgi:shikimate dehydrogenase
MKISGKTKITGIFGNPIEHTLSPAMHNSAFHALQMDICYVPFRVTPEHLPEAVQSIRSLNMMGVNITVPHKESVLPLLDKIDEEASFIGAVNTITNKDGFLTGYNTDGRGFTSSLAEEDISIENKNIIIIGTGGAARSVSYYLSEKAAKLSLFDIDTPKAARLASDLNRIRHNIVLLDDIERIDAPDIIINATPLGLKPDDPLPINQDHITSETVVCDLVYKKTPLLREAEKRNARIVHGAGMLLWQGVLAFELWTGIKPPVDVMRDALMSGIQ